MDKFFKIAGYMINIQKSAAVWVPWLPRVIPAMQLCGRQKWGRSWFKGQSRQKN